MSNINYLDWDGLVYYDESIKIYISDMIRNHIVIGGIIDYSDLPVPSQNNQNYLYKITNEFTATPDKFDVSDTFSEGTWVICVKTDTETFKYSIFEGFNRTELYTREEVDSLVYSAVNPIKSTYTRVSGNKLVFGQGDAEKDIIFDCGKSI